MRRLDLASWLLKDSGPAAGPLQPVELTQVAPAPTIVQRMELYAAAFAKVRRGALCTAATLLLAAGACAGFVVDILPEATGGGDSLEAADALVVHPAATMHGALAIKVDTGPMRGTILKHACVHGAIP